MMQMQSYIEMKEKVLSRHSDLRVQELLNALNERLLSREQVFDKIASIVGSDVSFYQYRDGSYFFCD